MQLGVDRIESESGGEEPTIDRSGRRRIDVTELDATGVREFVAKNVGTDDVSLEHRGGRTYLVVAE